MPSWAARLGLPISPSSNSNPSNSRDSLNTSSNRSPSGSHTHNRSPSTPHLRPPTLQQMDRSSLGHIRSVSHSNVNITGSSGAGGNSRVGAGGGSGRRAVPGRSSDSNLRAKQPPNVAMKSGKCACCESTVRWPSNLLVFRCVVCGTVNDLPGSVGRRAPPPITLEATRGIIEGVVDDLVETLKRTSRRETSIDALLESLSEKLSLADSSREDIPSTTSDKGKSPLSPAKSSSDILATQPENEAFLPSATDDAEEGEDERWQRREVRRVAVGRCFKVLEEYISLSFSSMECLNNSFLAEVKKDSPRKSRQFSAAAMREIIPRRESSKLAFDVPGEYEERLLRSLRPPPTAMQGQHISRMSTEKVLSVADMSAKVVSIRSPAIDWDSLEQFYDLVLNIGEGAWMRAIEALKEEDVELQAGKDDYEKVLHEPVDWSELEEEMREDVEEARRHVGRTLLKATETLLKRPGKRITSPDELRFILLIFANPLLYGPLRPFSTLGPSRQNSVNSPVGGSKRPLRKDSTDTTSHGPGQHSGIIKRLLGLTSSLPNELHHYLVSWFARYAEPRFRSLVELCGSFVTYRLTQQHGKNGGAATGKNKKVVYNDDWQVRVAARVMSLLFSANNNSSCRRDSSSLNRALLEAHGPPSNPALAARYDALRRGQIIPTSSFYNSLLDYADLIADYDSWESLSPKFSFCQYPFFLSIGSKIHILEYDARRQMELKAREAFFESISNRRSVSQYLVVRVRRECLVEDSLRGIAAAAGGGEEKKGLRVEFVGEDGVDAGGLRKEWFLLLVRDVFDPMNGMFLYDEDSNYCYFNPHSLESTESYYKLGMVFGLAIYNSTILDVSFPPVLFKKLAYAAQLNSASASGSKDRERLPRPPLVHTLADLAVYRPALARGLQQLLDYDGDVEEAFQQTFTLTTTSYGSPPQTIDLIPHGSKKTVTNSNRQLFVDAYISYILDTSVAKQYDPFKRGFLAVCAGNALTLFRAEEIELLIRGSEEGLDVDSLRAVAVTEGWPAGAPQPSWFWEYFARIEPGKQRALLSFITGSDRIPATGATGLVIRVVYAGEGAEGRYPTARTCFNALVLGGYKTRERLEERLEGAVGGSEGFGLK